MSDLRKLSEAATPGEWSAVPNNVFWELKPANRRDADPYTVADFCASEPDKRDGGIQEANVRFVAAVVNAYRSGSLIPRSEYERVLALLAEAREALRMVSSGLNNAFAAGAEEREYGSARRQEKAMEKVEATRAAARATLSRIDDALAAEIGAKA